LRLRIDLELDPVASRLDLALDLADPRINFGGSLTSIRQASHQFGTGGAP